MQQSWSLQLLVLTFLSLTSLTSCHPHPHDVSAVKAAPIPSASIQAAENLVRKTGPTDALAVKSLKRRSLGFKEFLDIGIGWNMYYSSWPAFVLPVRTYIYSQYLLVYSRNISIQKDTAIATLLTANPTILPSSTIPTPH